ncbi:MAG: hypothetical protein H0U76_02585 [Ktedonobacteraceae bacterium]|nr:hypothetical protein [Ktedonobacteraceae bacterium]MBA3825038.1 hypothetical protein [Ktedonobacterales bacterium]
MPVSQRARSARASAIARRVYAPAVLGQRMAAARAVVATMDVIEGGNGLTYLLRRCPVSGAVVQRIPVLPEAMPLLAYLRGDA